MASDLTSQIGTNYIPSEEELDHIKNSILPKPISKLADLEREIDRIQETYSSLMEQRQALLAEIEGYHNLISPARRLPIDILQEIFLHTLPTPHNALMDPHKCPLLLTRICHGWRKIALSTPQLWSSIHIPIPPLASGHHHPWGLMDFGNSPEEFKVSALSFLQKYAIYIANWLGRSGECPLSISLFDSRDSSSSKEHYDIIIDSLLPLARRWKKLTLDTRSPFLGRIAELTEYDVPLLESLSLHDIVNDGAIGSSDPLAGWEMSGIIRCHRLKKIDYKIEHNITKFSFKWAQLTDIKLTQCSDSWGVPNAHVSLKDLVVILSLAPCLINFHSEIRLAIGSVLASILTLPLVHLQKMVFHDGGVNCKPLFDLLDAPSLLHLEFFPIDISSITVLSTFLPQVSGTILSLTTPYFFFVKPNHHPALSQCHKLMSITIKSPPSLGPTTWSPALVDFVSDVFLDDLTLPTDHPDRLAPALEVFDCHTGGNFSDVAILRFIKTKHSRPDIAKLKRIFIQLNRPKEVNFFSDQEFLQYVAEGLDVDLRYLVGLNPQVPFVFRPDEGVELPDPHTQYEWAPNWA